MNAFIPKSKEKKLQHRRARILTITLRSQKLDIQKVLRLPSP